MHGTSTTDACFLLKETINNYINNIKPVYSHFIDLSKAFDSVNHFILLNKLIEREIPVDIVSSIKSYLRFSSARVIWNVVT